MMLYKDLAKFYDLLYSYKDYDSEASFLVDELKSISSPSILDVCWVEGYTNITANTNDEYQVAELFTSHSQRGFSHWNPLYLVKNNHTGQMDMYVDKQAVRLWQVPDVEGVLSSLGERYRIERSFGRSGSSKDIPIFILDR